MAKLKAGIVKKRWEKKTFNTIFNRYSNKNARRNFKLNCSKAPKKWLNHITYLTIMVDVFHYVPLFSIAEIHWLTNTGTDVFCLSHK